jgi:hypothetical protein
MRCGLIVKPLKRKFAYKPAADAAASTSTPTA